MPDVGELSVIFNENDTADMYINDIFQKTVTAEYSQRSIKVPDMRVEFIVNNDGTEIYEPNMYLTLSLMTELQSDGWAKAWVCNNGAWSDTILPGQMTAKGNIIAKIYETGNKITPEELDEGNEYKLIIEGNGEMGDLRNEDENAFAWQKELMMFVNGELLSCTLPYITEIEVAEGITNIGSYAFSYGISLENISIAESVNNIGKGAFEYCNSLINIELPSAVKTIEERTFYYSGLNSINIPNVTSIKQYAFYECINLSDINIPNVTTIGDSALHGCNALIAISIPKAEVLERAAFDQCRSLSNIVIANTMKNIEKDVFFDCKKLTTVTIDSLSIANGLKKEYDCGCLIDYATTLYIKSDLEVGEYVTKNFKQVESDKTGYIKYTK